MVKIKDILSKLELIDELLDEEHTKHSESVNKIIFNIKGETNNE